MFDVFGSVKGLIKLETICIDNNVFRLHYKATFIILVVASLLVTSRQYIGDPIDCIVEEIPNNVSNCTAFTWTMPDELFMAFTGKYIPLIFGHAFHICVWSKIREICFNNSYS